MQQLNGLVRILFPAIRMLAAGSSIKAGPIIPVKEIPFRCAALLSVVANQFSGFSGQQHGLGKTSLAQRQHLFGNHVTTSITEHWIKGHDPLSERGTTAG